MIPQNLNDWKWGSPVFISNTFKMSYFCRWQSLSISFWFLFASISDGDICWIYSQILTSSLSVARRLITIKTNKKNLTFGGHSLDRKDIEYFLFFETCLVSPLFLSPFSHAVFIYETTTISYLPLCSPHVPQSCSRAVRSFSAKFSVPSHTPDTSFLQDIYFLRH